MQMAEAVRCTLQVWGCTTAMEAPQRELRNGFREWSSEKVGSCPSLWQMRKNDFDSQCLICRSMVVSGLHREQGGLPHDGYEGERKDKSE